MTAPTRSRTDHAQIAAQLRARPGVWIAVGVYPASYSAASIGAHLRAGQGSFAVYAPAGAYESRTRPVDNGTLLEARYTVGAPGPTRSGRIEPLGDAARILGQIERGEIRCGPDAAREIAARHEDAYGAAWQHPAASAPAAVSADEAWAEALAGPKRPGKGARRKPIAHGEVKGASQHRYRGEPLCDACRDAVNAYQRQYQRTRRALNGVS